MKLNNTRTLAIACLLACSSFAHAQIEFEHTYPDTYSLMHISMSDGSIKYVTTNYDYPTYDISLYNLDYTLFREIHTNLPDYCPINSSGHLQPVRYVTDKLFDTDEGVEIFSVAECWDSVAQEQLYTVFILDEDGGVVFSRADATGNGDIMATFNGIGFSTVVNTPNGTKMVLYTTESHSMEVYSLPGTLPAMLEIAVDGNPEMKTYPNPVKSTFTVSYDTHGVPFGTLSVRDLNGHEVASQPFSGQTGSMDVDVSMLSSGAYTVALVADGKLLGSKKIVVTK